MKQYNQILLSHDPLDCAGGDVDTRFPRLKPDQVLTMVIRSAERCDNTEKGTEAIRFNLETTEPNIDTDGRPLAAGFKFRHRVNGASGERTADALAKDLAFLVKAVDGPKSTINLRQLWQNPGAFLDNKPVKVKVGIQKEQNGFPESNKATFVIPA